VVKNCSSPFLFYSKAAGSACFYARLPVCTVKLLLIIWCFPDKLNDDDNKLLVSEDESALGSVWWRLRGLHVSENSRCCSAVQQFCEVSAIGFEGRPAGISAALSQSFVTIRPHRTNEPHVSRFWKGDSWTRVGPRNHVWRVTIGVHIGATWRMRLNDHCAAAIRPYVKL